MGLPTSHLRRLARIEGKLAESDPHLESLFAFFTRLTTTEAMPWIEQVKRRLVLDRLAFLGFWFRRMGRRPAARVRAMILLPAALTAMVCALTMAFGFSGGPKAPPGARQTTARQLTVKHALCPFSFARFATC